MGSVTTQMKGENRAQDIRRFCRRDGIVDRVRQTSGQHHAGEAAVRSRDARRDPWTTMYGTADKVEA